MTAGLQSWLNHIPAFTGLLAAYVGMPEHPPRIRSWSDEYGPAGIQSLQRQVRNVLEVLDAGQMPARKLRWIFDRTVVYYERRKDGAGMCLITTHEPWVGESEIITNLIADFRSAV